VQNGAGGQVRSAIFDIAAAEVELQRAATLAKARAEPEREEDVPERATVLKRPKTASKRG